MKDSNIIFSNGARMELSNAELEMVGNNFVGNGTIAVGRSSAVTSLEKAQVILNKFDGV